MKKKTILWIVIPLVILGILFSLPVFFKKPLLEQTKKAITRQVSADVNFDRFRLSLFRNFPKVTLMLENLTVSGTGEFRGDTLLEAANVMAKMNLLSLFSRSGMTIEEIQVNDPVLKLIVGENGSVNWDLAAGQEGTSQSTNDKPAGEDQVEMKLDKIGVNNAAVFYDDREADMYLTFYNTNLDLTGKMYGTSAGLKGLGKVEKFSVTYGGNTYISNVSLETTTALLVDYEKMNFTISENELFVNRLPLEVSGMISIPSDSMYFDLKIQTRESGFEHFLGLVPPDYEEYLKDIRTSGNASVSGNITGWYFEEIYPAFRLFINVAGGSIKYAGLPEEVSGISAEISVENPGGLLDLTEIKVKKAHAEVKNNPLDLTLILKNLFTDLYFDGALVGTVNFDHLKNALPLDSMNMAGTIDVNLFAKGNYSSVKNEQYDKIRSDGIVLLDNFMYESPALTQKIIVPSGNLDFSPERVSLTGLNMKIGQSDFRLTGNVRNYLNYIFKEGTLNGDFQLNSNFLNINELLRIQKEIPEDNKSAEVTGTPEQQPQPAGTDSILVFDVPRNVDFTFRSEIQRALFDQVQINDIRGLITAKDGKLLLNGLDMKMLDGEFRLTGSYENTPRNQPLVDLGFDVINFDIPMAFQSFTGFGKMMPVAGHSQGRFSTSIKFNGSLSESLKVIPASVDGAGSFATAGLVIMNSPLFSRLKGILREDLLKNISVDDFNANFQVDDGNLLLKPFKTMISGQETQISGSLSAQNILDMRMDFKIPKDAFGPDIRNILSAIPGNRNITLVPAGVVIKGPVGNPEVKMDLDEAKKLIANTTKDELKNSLNKLGSGLKKLLDNNPPPKE